MDNCNEHGQRLLRHDRRHQYRRGLIAFMLGRLRMTIDECINVYTTLSDGVGPRDSANCHPMALQDKGFVIPSQILNGRFMKNH